MIVCLTRYMISYGEIDEEAMIKEVGSSPLDMRGTQHYATITPLLSCTNYSFLVAAVSKTETVGPGVITSANTLEPEGERGARM